MAESSEMMYFDLRIVHDHFNRSLIEEDDIDIKSYLEGYNELYKFFQLMGSVFSFVSSDLKQKIEILQCRANEDSENYVTIKRMVEHEKTNKLLERNDYVNGARTLLRLHRGLDFILEFLRQLSGLSNTDNTSASCRDAYNKTLAKHHPWLVRKAAVYAMYTMPNREALFKKVCGDEVQRNIDILPKMLQVTGDVLMRTQSVFEIHELLELP